jgi:hypothetical protein
MNVPHGPGHNKGPVLDGGTSWRRFAWARARADLLPVLPVEVVRLRVRRAAELGLSYRTYAGVRAASGRDVIGFLFSSNALRVLRAGDALPVDRAATLAALRGCDRTALVHRPLDPARLVDGHALDAAARAPGFDQSWSAMRARLAAVIRQRGRPADGYLVIGETAFERDWAEAARSAGFLSAERYFGGAG